MTNLILRAFVFKKCFEICNMKINLLAIGAHPDDIELGCGGTLLKHKKEGFTTGIIDLTKGELGTRGSAEIRTKEAKLAAKLLNVDIRNNLMLTDGFFENNKKNQLKLIKLIRKHKPDIILTNAYSDRHPDHGRAARLVNDSCFPIYFVKLSGQLYAIFSLLSLNICSGTKNGIPILFANIRSVAAKSSALPAASPQ